MNTKNENNLNSFWQVKRAKFDYQKRASLGNYAENNKDLFRMSHPDILYVDGVPLSDIFKELNINNQEELTEGKIKEFFKNYLLKNMDEENKAHVDDYVNLLSKIMYQGGLLNPLSQAISDVSFKKSKGEETDLLINSDSLDRTLYISTKNKGSLILEEKVSTKKVFAPNLKGGTFIENADESPLFSGACKYEVVFDAEKNEQNESKGILKYKVTDFCMNYNNEDLQSVIDERKIWEKVLDFFASIFRFNKYTTEEMKQEKDSTKDNLLNSEDEESSKEKYQNEEYNGNQYYDRENNPQGNPETGKEYSDADWDRMRFYN